MKINRPRLLAGSLAIALVLSVVGGYVWAQVVSDDGDTDPVDATLADPGDREIPTAVNEIAPNEAVQGEAFPVTVLSDQSGADVETSSLLGDRPLVVNFWFSTCPPCRKELPDFAAVHEEFGESVRFVGVNPFDSAPVMERFAAERGVTYELFLDVSEALTNAVGISNFPTTLFVTSDGTIVEQTGVVDAAGLRQKIADLQSVEEAA